MDFQDLCSVKKFRLLFLSSGIFKSDDEFDENIARDLWNHRYPKLKWGICGIDNCQDLTPEGEKCSRHMLRTGKLPSWKYSNGKLYKLQEGKFTKSGVVKSNDEYIQYEHSTASRRWGRIPSGFVVVCIDGNPFNLHWANLLILSRISATCVKEKALTVEEAIKVDEVLHDFLVKKNGDEVFMYWCYSLGDLMEVTGLGKPELRDRIQRGKLNPHRFSETARLILDCRS